MNVLECKVPDDFIGSERLDKFISSLPGGMNRSHLKSVAEEIYVNQKKEKISCRVKSSDSIKIIWKESFPSKYEAENIPLEIIYEDKNVCVVNKAQGMVSHPAPGNWSGTLVNALLFHFGKNFISELDPEKNTESEILANRRPGIVHRLDKETSGIIITAKNPETHEFLSAQFKNHKSVVKEYIAICVGRPQKKSGVIKTQIIRDPKDRKKFKSSLDENEGKYAETHYNCIACYGNYSLMCLRIKTGRTHQIRVHLKFINCPILGDSIYSKSDKKFPDATLMLHSKRLKILVPKDFSSIPPKAEVMEFKTQTPLRFKKVLKVLHRDYKKDILQD